MRETTDAVLLSFYTHARTRHDGKLLYEWLLELARARGVGGGSAFRAIAGYGRHGALHEETFFELADDMPVKVEFMLRADQADALVAAAHEAGVDTVYAVSTIRLGVPGKA